MHGGLSPELESLSQIESIKRPLVVKTRIGVRYPMVRPRGGTVRLEPQRAWREFHFWRRRRQACLSTA